jgi:predicted alpha/beta-fold hydrolase
MAGNITVKYLGVHGKEAPDVIRHAAAFSAPTDLRSGAEVLDVPSNAFYKKRFLKKLSRKIVQKAQQFPGKLDVDKLPTVKVCRDFDELFSSTLGGYRDADDFYYQASALNYIPSIRIPILLVNALNDPILTPLCAPR